MDKTIKAYDEILEQCKSLFVKKNQDYGSSWRILRPSSLTDQIFIKAMRIRSIEEKGEQKVEDSVEGEYIGIVNYSIIALIQMTIPPTAPLEMDNEELAALYEAKATEARALMINKNHDYGEVWREMRMSSLTDMILSKLLRIKQIEENLGTTLVSEGIAANYLDIINYAIFALIKTHKK